MPPGVWKSLGIKFNCWCLNWEIHVIPCLTSPNQLFLPPTFGRQWSDYDKPWILDLKPAMARQFLLTFCSTKPTNPSIDGGRNLREKSMKTDPCPVVDSFIKRGCFQLPRTAITCSYYGINRVQSLPFYSVCSVFRNWFFLAVQEL